MLVDCSASRIIRHTKLCKVRLLVMTTMCLQVYVLSMPCALLLQSQYTSGYLEKGFTGVGDLAQ